MKHIELVIKPGVPTNKHIIRGGTGGNKIEAKLSKKQFDEVKSLIESGEDFVYEIHDGMGTTFKRVMGYYSLTRNACFPVNVGLNDLVVQ